MKNSIGFFLIILMLICPLPVIHSTVGLITAPIANAGNYQTVRVGEKVTFDGSKSIGEGLSYTWNFGDGSKASSSSLPQTTHVYSNQGIYSVTLTVTNQYGLSGKDSIKVTVATILQLFFHNDSYISNLDNNFGISIEGVNALLPIQNRNCYQEISCLQSYEQDGLQVWVGGLLFLTSVLPKNLYVAGNVEISFFINSTEAFSSKSFGGYTFGVLDIDDTGEITTLYQYYPPKYTYGKNPFLPKPNKTSLSINVDHIFNASHQIGFSIGIGGSKKGWKVGVSFDSLGQNSGVVLPVVDPPSDSRFTVSFQGNNYPIVIRSNSSLSTSLQFTPTPKSISFQASMIQGTGGFCNISIPKSFLSEPYKVTVDGLSQGFTFTSNSTCSFLFFTYSHGKVATTITVETF